MTASEPALAEAHVELAAHRTHGTSGREVAERHGPDDDGQTLGATVAAEERDHWHQDGQHAVFLDDLFERPNRKRDQDAHRQVDQSQGSLRRTDRMIGV